MANENQFREMFQEVFHCNGEDDLYKIVSNNALLKDSSNWFPYGGKDKDDRSNFSTFENQQALSGAALVEKVTNSIDALLLKECKRRGIDPKSQEAPSSMEMATEQFFDIPKGDIGELLSKERMKIAINNIQIVATGTQKDTDLMIYDNGEGQHPDNFKNTFLSLAKNNKTDIPFVQGKYNMGSTGAVVFCGDYRYQLIASKMNDEVFGKQSQYSKNLFGWTLVRRHILTEEEEKDKYGNSWYEYFAIDGKKIPQFEIDELDIGLYGDSKQFVTGSFIKLYSYEMPQGAKGEIRTHLYRELNQLLYKPALPFWLSEKRKDYQGRERTTMAVYGNHVRINSNEDGEDEALECPPIYEAIEEAEIGILEIQAVVLKKGKNTQQNRDRKRSFIGSRRNVIYTLNGQVQGHEGLTFITQELNFYFIKDFMLIVIDCSKVRTSFRQDLFMANRSHLRQSDKLELLKGKVIKALKNNETLRRIETERKNAMLQGGDDKEEKELLEGLLSKVPLEGISLADFLKKGGDAVNLPHQKDERRSKGRRRKRPQETKRFPSIFKIKDIKEDKNSGKQVKSIPLNGKGVIKFETDVAEDYFYRPQEKGEFQILILEGKDRHTDNPVDDPTPNNTKVVDFFEVNKSGPSNGSIKLTLKPKDNLNVGDEMKLNARLTSPDGDMESIFYVKIVNPKKHENAKIKKEPEKPELPRLLKISKREDGSWQQDNGEPWSYEDWDENSIIKIMPTSDGKKTIVSAIAVNMASYSLKKYLSKNQVKDERGVDYLSKQYAIKMYLHGLCLFTILDGLKSQKNNQERYADTDQDSGDLLAQIFKSYGDVLIYLDTNKAILDELSE